ncbi:MAG: hypothetical protein HY381_01910 [Candidatus Chisholmbacteria bacterium]|nr:hypothetical protein [Candidatus Chisholmbacteria bacterium]
MTDPSLLPPISDPETNPSPGLLTKLIQVTQPILHSPRFLPLFIFTAALLTLLVILLRTYSFKPLPPPQPLPTPVSSPQLPPLPPSPFATDAAILDLNLRLTSLQTEINQTDMEESNLLPPPLDLNVTFE